jgi:hypothetical protein
MGDLDCFLDLSLQKNKLNNKVPIIIIDMEQYVQQNSFFIASFASVKVKYKLEGHVRF